MSLGQDVLVLVSLLLNGTSRSMDVFVDVLGLAPLIRDVATLLCKVVDGS